MTTFKLVATSAMGLESIVADEVKALGYETTTENGKIYFEGDERAIARANIWLRVADRVKIVAAQFPVKTFDELLSVRKQCNGRNSYPWMQLFLFKESRLNQHYSAFQIVKRL